MTAGLSNPIGTPIRLSYLICASPRTGSNWLCELLRSTGVAGRPDEYFWNYSIWQERWDVPDFAGYVERVLRDGATPNGVFGVKVMRYLLDDLLPKFAQVAGLPEADPPAVLSAIFPNPQFVWLVRRDKVRQAISHYRALKTNAWRSTDLHPDAGAEPDFDRAAIDHLARESAEADRTWQDFFRQHGIEPFPVVYEDLAADPAGVGRQILQFLRLPPPIEPWPPAWRHQPQADTRTDDWIRQYHARLTPDS